MKRLPKAGLEILHLGMEACLFSFVARYLCECQLHRNVSLLSLPYKEDCNQILYAKKKRKWLETLRLLHHFWLYYPLRSIKHVQGLFPWPGLLTVSTSCSLTLELRGALLSLSPWAFLLLLFFGEGKRINLFPRGLGYSVSSPHR